MPVTDFPGGVDDTSGNIPGTGANADTFLSVTVSGDSADFTHPGHHQLIGSAVEAIEAKVGIGASTPTLGLRLVGSGTGTSAWRRGGTWVVTDHGLLGDNSTDNTAAWAALTALVSAAGGGRIEFPAGIFLATGGFPVAYDSVHVRGAGWNATILKTSTPGASVMAVTGDYCSVGDIMFAGGADSAGDGGAENGLLLSGAYGFYGENVWATRMEYGIRLTGASSSATSHAARFHNVAVSRCGVYGIDIASWAYDGQWTNVWVGLCDIGMRVNDGANRITNLHVWDSYGGDNVKLTAGYNHLVNVYIEKGGWVDGARTSGVGDGIDISSSYNTVTGGLIANNGAMGVHISGGTHNTVSGLQVYNNQKGIRLVSSSTDNTLVGIHCFDLQDPKTQLYGVEVNTGCTGTQVIGLKSKDADHLTEGMSFAAGTVDLLLRADDITALGDITADRYVASATSGYRLGSTSGPRLCSGTGDPNDVVSAPLGSIFLRTDGSTSTTLYVKTAGGGGATGWTAK